MLIEYIDHYGSDLTVVNAARVSMGKAHTTIDDSDKKLIEYLARENHFMPFCHPHITMRFTCPVFIARQLAKHQIGFSWSEESLRYIAANPVPFYPEKWRKQAPNVKQGSSDEAVDVDEAEIRNTVDQMFSLYKKLLEQGVCKEQARMLLPMNTEVTWIWTGSLAAWARLWGLRSDPHAQFEVQLVAKGVAQVLEPIFPLSWQALVCPRSSEAGMHLEK